MAGGNVTQPPIATTGTPSTNPITGQWFPSYNGATLNTTGGSSATMRVYPFFIPKAFTVTDMGVIVLTSGGTNGQFYVYANNATTNRPTGTPLAAVQLSTATAASVSATLGTPVALTAGIYWAGAEVDNSTVIFHGIGTQTNVATSIIGRSTLAGLGNSSNISNTILAITRTYTPGTNPDLTSASFTESSTNPGCPVIGLKVQ